MKSAVGSNVRRGGTGSPPPVPAGGVTSLVARRREAGMISAEYAIGTCAAAGFAAVLLAVINSGSVTGLITGVVSAAFSVIS